MACPLTLPWTVGLRIFLGIFLQWLLTTCYEKKIVSILFQYNLDELPLLPSPALGVHHGYFIYKCMERVEMALRCGCCIMSLMLLQLATL